MAGVLKFKTRGEAVPLLPPGKDYVFILEDLELAFPKEQLSEITKRWNTGEEIEDIAADLDRHYDEVFLALYHQARRRRIHRPYAGRFSN